MGAYSSDQVGNFQVTRKNKTHVVMETDQTKHIFHVVVCFWSLANCDDQCLRFTSVDRVPVTSKTGRVTFKMDFLESAPKRGFIMNIGGNI